MRVTGMTTTQQETYRALVDAEAHDSPAHRGNVAQLLGVSHDTATSRLSSLVRDGFAVRTSIGFYTAVGR